MLNIFLRRFKEKDLEALKECVEHKIIPVVCGISLDAKTMLEDYMQQDMETELALAIANSKTDTMLGTINSLLIDDVFLTSYYVLPQYQNQGICTEALRLFIEYIRKNKPNVRRIELCINQLNVASQKVANKNGFKIESKNEFVLNWIYNL